MRFIAILIALACPAAGCVVAAVAAAAAATYGVVKYTENGAEQDFHADLDSTFAATVQALRHLDYPVAEDLQPGATEGKIQVRDVSVAVERHASDFTRVCVRVGTFETEENQRRAGLILEEVQRRLSEAA